MGIPGVEVQVALENSSVVAAGNRALKNELMLLGNDRKAFFHFGRYRKGTGRKLSISAGTVIPAETLSTGRNTLFRPKDILSAKRLIQ